MTKALPRSAVIVLRHLSTKGPMCPQDISECSSLAPRTVSFALRRLVKAKLAKKIPNLSDMRRPLYTPNNDGIYEVVQKNGQDSIIGTQLTMITRR